MPNSIWNDLLSTGEPISHKLIRTLVVYFFLVFGLRLAGKRELAQLNPFDFVVLMLLANTVQNAVIGNDNSVIGGLLGAATLLAVNYALVRFLYRHERLDQLIEGSPTTLIQDGAIRHQELERECITLAELEMAAHKNGFSSLDVIERAILEPGGVITFVGKRPYPEEARHQELLAELTKLAREIAELKQLRTRDA